MATAIGSVKCFREESKPDFNARSYQNCHTASSLPPYYENCFFSKESPNLALAFTNSGYNSPFNVQTLPPLFETLPGDPKRRKSRGGERYSTGFGTRSDSARHSSAYHSEDETEPKAVVASYGKANQKFLSLRKGIGDSMGNESKLKKSSKKLLKKFNNTDFNSDNGGFESVASKPSLGVKEKLRYSLDKLSIKSPFRWNSSDKLSPKSSKGSKAKSKNDRRLSDSNAGFLTANSNTMDNPKSSRSFEHAKKNKTLHGLSRMVRAYPVSRSDSPDDELIRANGTNSVSNREYVNVQNHSKPAKLQSSTSAREFNPQAGWTENERCQSRNLNYYQDVATLSAGQNWKNADTASKAKGTWKMLKATKTKQTPVKAGSSDLVGYPDYPQPSSLHQDDFIFSGKPPEVSSEPPKLAPVSGKLLFNQESELNIIRPTAFRPTPVSHHSPSYHYVKEESWRPTDNDLPVTSENSNRKEMDTSANSRSTSNNSDSGRLSATSIPVGVVIAGSFSCSGSEGYESARIPSSTNHSTVHDHEGSAVDTSVFSARKLSDDALLCKLENRVRERQDQVEILRKDIEDNQKALRDIVSCNKVVDERDLQTSESSTIKEKKQSQSIKLQRRTSVHEHQLAEQQYRRLHQEQKQLQDANDELEERIRTMTEAIDAQSQHQDIVSKLQQRLDENEAELKQRLSDVSLLKREIKEKEEELGLRLNELMSARSENKALSSRLGRQDGEIEMLHAQLNKERTKIADLEHHLAARLSHRAYSSADAYCQSSSRNETSLFHHHSNSRSSDSSCHFAVNSPYHDVMSPIVFNQSHVMHREGLNFSHGDKEELCKRLQAAEQRCALQEQAFEREKQQWAQDKSKVIKYQKVLQDNYVQMYKRSHALEQEVKSLTTRLERVGMSNGEFSGNELAGRQQNLSYPMDI